MPNLFAVKVAGPAGAGIQSAGETLCRAFVKAGYFVSGYPEYNSLIKGGHGSYLVTLSATPFPNNAPKIDVLLPLTQAALENEHAAISEATNVIADTTFKFDHPIAHLHQPELLQTAKEAGNPLTLNTAALGFLAHQIQFPPELLLNLILEDLAGKSQTLLDQNKAAFNQAYELSKKYYLNLKLPEKRNQDHRLVLTGSQAAGLGAIAAGLNLYAGYPMTPSSPLLHFLAAHQSEFNYLVRQTEDEISAINLTIGASFTGAKSMTGTSGGGFALMQEGIALAGMLETPIVIYLASRPGPATGLPTWSSQGDLLFAINAGHGEFPKIVLAPGDPLEAYLLTHQAFAYAQTYHVPVIVLSDKILAENIYSLSNLPVLEPVPLSVNLPTGQGELFARYQYSPTGVHPRTLPGMSGGEYIANSDEHDPTGLVDESAENRTLQNQRRLNKFNTIKKNIPAPQPQGEGRAALITWGSNKYIGAAVAAELKAAHLHFTHLWPLPENLADLLSPYEKLITVENNLTHQFARLLTAETGLKVHLKLGEDTGRPLDPDLLVKKIKDEL